MTKGNWNEVMRNGRNKQECVKNEDYKTDSDRVHES